MQIDKLEFYLMFPFFAKPVQVRDCSAHLDHHGILCRLARGKKEVRIFSQELHTIPFKVMRFLCKSDVGENLSITYPCL